MGLAGYFIDLSRKAHRFGSGGLFDEVFASMLVRKWYIEAFLLPLWRCVGLCKECQIAAWAFTYLL
jgi:hypothetical protein